MKTTRSLDLKVMKLTRAVNMVANQVAGHKAWAGFKETKLYKDSGLTTAQLAAVLNYGSPHNNLPARPFMENAITHYNKTRINRIIKKHLQTLFRDELESMKYEYETFSYAQNPRYQKRAVKALMQELAEALHKNILNSIKLGKYEPLSPEYAKLTGKTKFLENSGDFVSQISHGVD